VAVLLLLLLLLLLRMLLFRHQLRKCSRERG
jgi:hypothetical protein